MITISYLVLAVASLCAAIVLYRQPVKFSDKNKGIVSILRTCCLLVSVSALLPLFFDANGEDQRTLLLIFTNLQVYLLLPLFACVVFITALGRQFSKGSWGRWSLVLIAIFEICRRAEVGETYASVIAMISCVFIACGLFYQNKSAPIALSTLAITSYSGANLIFSPHLALFDSANQSYFNLSLALGLLLVCFCFGQRIGRQNTQPDDTFG